MPDLVCNIAKGRVAELYNRVDAGDPTAARLYVIVISAGAATDDNLRDADDFAAIITAGATERNTNGWTRKELTGTDLVALSTNLDDTNNWLDLDIPDQTWTAVAGAGGAATDLVICYASVASPTNAQLIPLTVHDFAVTPDGSDITAVINTEGFYRAS